MQEPEDSEHFERQRHEKFTRTAVPKEKTLLVGARRARETRAMLDEHLDELERLVETAGGVVVGRVAQELRSITPATLIGSGKVEELKDRIAELGADSVVFDHQLTPAQQRNLTEQLETKVLERAQVILDIFVRHARTREAKVQVELAQLEYLLPRLAGMWKHLERQRGGIGVRGGAGEAQIELDRRIVRYNIAKLKKRLEQIRTQRQTQRKRRSSVFRVALVGYTNAGKSTLMSKMTGAKLYIADQLFATLDPAVKSLETAAGQDTVLIDTVGFIRKLPHQLVASFRSTLEEVLEADVLLLISDAGSEALEEQVRVVRDVLEEIGAGAIPALLVMNQIDRLDPEAAQHLQTLYPEAYLVSAITGQGVPDLLIRLEQEQERWRRTQAHGPSGDQVHVATGTDQPEWPEDEELDEAEAVEQ